MYKENVYQRQGVGVDSRGFEVKVDPTASSRREDAERHQQTGSASNAAASAGSTNSSNSSSS